MAFNSASIFTSKAVLIDVVPLEVALVEYRQPDNTLRKRLAIKLPNVGWFFLFNDPEYEKQLTKLSERFDEEIDSILEDR